MTTNLQVFKHTNGQLMTDSRAVAEMVGKRHDHLIRDIQNYCQILEENTAPIFGVSDFFQESSYQDSTGRTLPCYRITKKGCEMIANKLTGKKGILFTAAYVTRFNEMEETERNKGQSFRLPQTLTEALRAFADEVEAHETTRLLVEAKEKEVKQLKPKADTYDEIMNTKATYTVTYIAETLEIGSHELFKILKENNWLHRPYHGRHRPTPEAPAGVFKEIKSIYGEQTRVTLEGYQKIADLIDSLRGFERQKI